jgi:hypothetical protein
MLGAGELPAFGSAAVDAALVGLTRTPSSKVSPMIVLRAIRRFWTSIEKDVGTFEHLDDVDLDEVVPLSLVVLQMCVDAYLEGLRA